MNEDDPPSSCPRESDDRVSAASQSSNASSYWTRRDFLASTSAATSGLIYQSGVARANDLEPQATMESIFVDLSESGSVTRISTTELRFIRNDDLLMFKLHFNDLEMDPDGRKLQVVKRPGGAEIRPTIVIEFPPQHIAEESVPYGEHLPPGLLERRASEPTWICYRVTSDDAEIPVSVEGFLSTWMEQQEDGGWLKLKLPDLATKSTFPDNLSEPKHDVTLDARDGKVDNWVTAIELPYRLLLAPTDPLVLFVHHPTPVEFKGRRELWHTRLERDRHPFSMRAVWTPDYGRSKDSPPPPFITSLSTEDRKDIVDLTSTALDERRDLDVTQLLLSPLGGYLQTDTHWNSGRIQRWNHDAGLGRDQHVIIERAVFCLPFAVHAILVQKTRRRIFRRPGEIGRYAALETKYYLDFPEPEVTYPNTKADARVPFGKIRIGGSSEEGTYRTPPLLFRGPDDKEGSSWSDIETYWPALVAENPNSDEGNPAEPRAPKLFYFPIEGTDSQGEKHEFAMPMMVVRYDPVSGEPYMGDEGSKEEQIAARRKQILEEYNSIGSKEFSDYEAFLKGKWGGDNGLRQTFFPWKKIALTGGDTAEELSNAALPVREMVFEIDTASTTDTEPRSLTSLQPRVSAINLRVPSYESLSASKGAVWAHPRDTATTRGLIVAKGEAGKSDIPPEANTKLGLDFSKNATSSGGFAAVQQQFAGVSKDGVISLAEESKASPEQFVGGRFNAQDCLPKDARIFGAVPLRQVVREGDHIKDNAPQIRSAVVYINGEPSVKAAQIYWKTAELQAVEKVFEPGDKAYLEINSTVEVWRKDGASKGNDTKATLNDFQLNFHYFLVGFKKMDFSYSSAKGWDFKPSIETVEFSDELGFLKDLAAFCKPSGSGNNSSGFLVEMNGLGIDLGFRFALPTLSLGVISLSNLGIALGMRLNLKLDEVGQVAMGAFFSFGSRRSPFLVRVGFLGGGGFIRLDNELLNLPLEGKAQFEVGKSRRLTIQAAIEFGGLLDIDFVVAKGQAYLLVGIYYLGTNEDIYLEAYVRAGANVTIIGLIEVAIELYIGLSYDSQKEELAGHFRVFIEVSVFFFSTGVEWSGSYTLANGIGIQAGASNNNYDEYWDMLIDDDYWNAFEDVT